MNEPRGPHSPSVYRRRRAMAMAGLGVGAVLFIWAVGALLGGDDSPAVRGAANVRPDGGPPLTSTQVSNPPTTGPIARPGGPSGSASAAASGSMTPYATAPSIAPSVTATTSPSTTASTTPPVTTTTTPAPPVACPDSAMRVTVTTDRPSYPSGSRPVLTLHIGNAGQVPCVRDVSHQLRSIEILAVGNPQPVWMNSYCYSLNTHELHTFAPGESLSYTIRWAGRTAAPGCPLDRTTVPAGHYEVIGRLGALTGPPTPLTLT